MLLGKASASETRTFSAPAPKPYASAVPQARVHPVPLPSIKTTNVAAIQKTPKPRGASAYLHFTHARRPEVLVEHPDLAVPDVMKRLKTEWKSLTPDQKAPYHALAAVERASLVTQKPTPAPANEEEVTVSTLGADSNYVQPTLFSTTHQGEKDLDNDDDTMDDEDLDDHDVAARPAKRKRGRPPKTTSTTKTTKSKRKKVHHQKKKTDHAEDDNESEDEPVDWSRVTPVAILAHASTSGPRRHIVVVRETPEKVSEVRVHSHDPLPLHEVVVHQVDRDPPLPSGLERDYVAYVARFRD